MPHLWVIRLNVGYQLHRKWLVSHSRHSLLLNTRTVREQHSQAVTCKMPPRSTIIGRSNRPLVPTGGKMTFHSWLSQAVTFKLPPRSTIGRSNRPLVPRGGKMTFHSCIFSNDPAAGSPTATLLRLLLPLIWRHRISLSLRDPKMNELRLSQILCIHIIGSNDGRCVQLAGT